MVKHFLFSVSFLAIIAAPSYAGPPRNSYGPGIDLLKQAAVQLALAQSMSEDPDHPFYGASILAITDAIAAAEKACADGVKGGEANKNADFAAFNALSAAMNAYYLFTVETDPVAKACWLEAANSAIQGAILLDKAISRDWPY